MYKNLIGIVAIALSLAFSQATFAHSSFCGEGLGKMVESLKLDDAQKAKIKPILEQLKSTAQNTWPQMKDLKVKLDQQVTSPTMDQSTVDGIVDQKTKLIGDMMKAKIAAKNQIYNVLNEEQKTKLQTMMKNAEEKMEAKFKDCHDDQ